MYEEYFELSGAPFKLSPDPKFFFGSRSHNKAMAYLHYGLKQAEGFIVITGPVGAGKTMLIGQLLDQLNRSNIIAAQLLTSNINSDELLSHILSAFRIEPAEHGRTGQLEAFEDYLFDQLNRGRRVLLIVDEAQNLPRETLEELRMLSNIDYDGTPLFQVFLVGQTEFRDIMSAPDMEQLRQRVTASYHLENLTRDETKEYIFHRLSVAGWREDPKYSEESINSIFSETSGLPRRINTLCNRLMLYCALENCHEVDSATVKTVISELHEEKLGAAVVKKVALPKVRKLGEGVDDAAHINALADKSKEDVVIPMFENETVKISDAASRENDDALTVECDEDENVPENTGVSDIANVANDICEDMMASIGDAETHSVFDRLRAKRERQTETDSPTPHEATLDDVATAIAAASVKQTSLEEVQNPYDGNVHELNKHEDRKTTAPIAKDRTAWKHSMIGAINETRDELKDAHSSVKKLKQSLKVMQKRRGAAQKKITARLSHAESLINELRNVWR